MKSKLWRRAETVFHRALEISDSQREVFLKTACEGDPELFSLVQELLHSFNNPGSFMEEPVLGRGLEVLRTDNVLTIRKKLGRYEIIKPIGTGGMGEVFLAHDLVLNRYVALKLLPTLLTDDPQHVRRFHQEAHAASTISHPNVAHIYEIGTEGNCHFTSMEYVEGRTLREVLNESRLSVPEALEIALQVGRALESAHASGVIHRDIKPENIMIRPDGYVKVLDFGLAKLDRMVNVDDLRQTQAATMVHTEPGLIMGSPAYMSPEQARGVEVDTRTDIWSLGVVLYEMLCGCTPFQGSTKMDLFAALLREEPAPISVPLRHAHPRLRKLLARMLSKDKDQRYLNSSEVIKDLQSLIRDLRWNTNSENRSRLFQDSRIAFVKHKVLVAFRSCEGTMIKGPLPFFIMTVIIGMVLTWSIKRSDRPQVLESNPEADRHYQKALEVMFRDDFYLAVSELDLATRTRGGDHARSIMVRARLAEVWAELDYSEKANYELSMLANLVPAFERIYGTSEINSWYVAAVRATVARNFRDALWIYRKIVEKDPTNAFAWMDLGRSYERLRWWEQAAYSYRQASAKNPSLASAFLRLGISEAARKKDGEANIAFDRASQLYRMANDEDGLLELLNQRIVLAYRLGRRDEVRRFQEEAIRINHINGYQVVKHDFSLARIFHADKKRANELEREARRRAESIGRVNLLFRGPDQLLVNGLVDIALLYLGDNNHIKAQEYIIEALRIAERSDLKFGKSKALYAHAQQCLHLSSPDADRYFKQVLRIEIPNREFSDQTVALWRNTILDVDYEDALAKFKSQNYQ